MIRRLGIMLTVLIASYLLLTPISASAQGVNDFVVNNFKSNYFINNDLPGGSLVTSEKIDVTFSADNHGIVRALQSKYDGYNTKVKVKSVKRDGNFENYTTTKENDNLILKIGSSGTTITGAHTYEIEYYQERVIVFERGSEFIWNTNGTQWDQPVDRIESTVHFVNNKLDPSKVSCFTGVQGSDARNCTVAALADGSVTVSASGLKPHENMTIQSQTPPNMPFENPGLWPVLIDSKAAVVALIIDLVVLVGAIVAWLFLGRDYRGRGVIVPEYDPPQNLTPGEVGLLADYKVDSRDITATLIDLAVRGYIRIHDQTSVFLKIKTYHSYSLELLNNNVSGLKSHESALMTAIFGSNSPGFIIGLDYLDASVMSDVVKKIKNQLRTDLIDTYGLIQKGGYGRIIAMFVVAGLVFFSSFFFGSMLLGFVAFISAVIIVILGINMPRRTHAGVETFEKIQGLKLFMKTSERDRLSKMQSVDRPYAPPSQTVELYEELLPFAVALGVEKSWSKQFDGILKESPSWYAGDNVGAFQAGYLASSLGSMSSGLGSSFESNSTTSSGSSGGFSGGGGGGGGGGGW